MSSLSKNLQYLKGVGEERARLFAKLGVRTLGELVRYFPRDYEDRTVVKPIGELIDGESVCVRAMAGGAPRLSRIAGGRDLVRVRAVDDSGSIELYFFNRPYVKNSLIPGETYTIYGKVSRQGSSISMANPVFERSAGGATGRIVPVYGLTAKLNQYSVSRAVQQALDTCGSELPEVLPATICAEYDLAQTRDAYANIHFPDDFAALSRARRRFIFEELFIIAAMSQLRRQLQRDTSGYVFPTRDFDEFFSSLPFLPTAAQARAIGEAAADCGSGLAMNRLVHGDVGSGKTLVAEALCWLSAKSGYQAAFMAPTELLAEQHYRTFSATLEPLGIRTALLTGGMGTKAKRETNECIAQGEADVVIGTHALISESVYYKNLGLVITDEQHRFGVNQRATLGRKGEAPHALVMSATPIPRTLALILYGDLDISVIDELPPGRQSIETYSVGEKMRKRIYDFTRKIIGEGGQAYFVCPAVEESDLDDGLKRAREYARQLQEKIFPDLHIGLVHGSMKSKDKDAAMGRFLSGETQILVATTVIEVGVDVPNATLMVIENADRYGLSQLHQLRGRVGRGARQSYCVMFEGAGGEKARERLQTLCDTTDGFKIAEADLNQRGPGDFFGSRQHGIPAARFIEMSSEAETVWQAREAAESVLERDPELRLPEHKKLRDGISAIMENASGTFN